MAERKIIIVISGEIASGKTTLAQKLESRFGFKLLKTRDALIHLASKKLAGESPSRSFLQKFGANLDATDGGKWVLNYFQNDFGFSVSGHSCFVVDAVRILNQINHFRDAFSYAVCHIHLTASKKILKERFLGREEIKDLSEPSALKKYNEATLDPTEQQVQTLAQQADITIDTGLCTEEDVFIRIASLLKLLPQTNNELVDVIVGGQFGSEGKGHVAAHIAPEYDCLVRVGGPNAGHTVFEKPLKHVFHLLPSGSHRNQTAKLILGPGTIINVDTLLSEISQYHIVDEQDKMNRRLVIDENAIIISNEQIELEQSVKKTIGSTGQGVGAATANNILARLYANDKHKAKNNKRLQEFIGSTYEELEKMYQNNHRVLIEGTQGTGLSLHHGIYPYVTSRDTTVSGCLSEVGVSPKRVRKIIMVTRTYPIRVGGNSGPFFSKEIDFETIANRSGKDLSLLKSSEKTTTTKVQRRIAEFSWTLFRKACELNSPTDIALTFTDYFSKGNENVRRYDQLTEQTRQFIEELEMCSGVKVSLVSTCFDYRAIIDRRNWK